MQIKRGMKSVTIPTTSTPTPASTPVASHDAEMVSSGRAEKPAMMATMSHTTNAPTYAYEPNVVMGYGGKTSKMGRRVMRHAMTATVRMTTRV